VGNLKQKQPSTCKQGDYLWVTLKKINRATLLCNSIFGYIICQKKEKNRILFFSRESIVAIR